MPTHDEARLFELFLLEPFQAGLSWETVLKKRSAFRRAFDGFNPEKIAAYGEEKLAELMSDPSLIRNRKKMEAAVNNAAVFISVSKEWGGFSNYIWHFTNSKTVYEFDKTSSPLSDAISNDLKRRGMKFIGTTVIYAYLQAIGVINSHTPNCFLFKG